MSIGWTLTAAARYVGIGARVLGSAPGGGDLATVPARQTVAISPLAEDVEWWTGLV
jgi:hypothetical protein